MWVEVTPGSPPDTFHRLASEVLSHGLFPNAGEQSDPAIQRQAIEHAIEQVLDAMNIIAEFFTASVVAFLREHGAQRRDR